MRIHIALYDNTRYHFPVITLRPLFSTSPLTPSSHTFGILLIHGSFILSSFHVSEPPHNTLFHSLYQVLFTTSTPSLLIIMQSFMKHTGRFHAASIMENHEALLKATLASFAGNPILPPFSPPPTHSYFCLPSIVIPLPRSIPELMYPTYLNSVFSSKSSPSTLFITSFFITAIFGSFPHAPKLDH